MALLQLCKRSSVMQGTEVTITENTSHSVTSATFSGITIISTALLHGGDAVHRHSFKK